jgi:hypothetical protein
MALVLYALLCALRGEGLPANLGRPSPICPPARLPTDEQLIVGRHTQAEAIRRVSGYLAHYSGFRSRIRLGRGVQLNAPTADWQPAPYIQHETAIVWAV